jgi:hypothetical protein
MSALITRTYVSNASGQPIGKPTITVPYYGKDQRGVITLQTFHAHGDVEDLAVQSAINQMREAYLELLEDQSNYNYEVATVFVSLLNYEQLYTAITKELEL